MNIESLKVSASTKRSAATSLSAMTILAIGCAAAVCAPGPVDGESSDDIATVQSNLVSGTATESAPVDPAVQEVMDTFGTAEPPASVGGTVDVVAAQALGAAPVAASAVSATVNQVKFAGVEQSVNGECQAACWSLSGVPKQFAVRDNRFGTSGHYGITWVPFRDEAKSLVAPMTSQTLMMHKTWGWKPDFLVAHPTPVLGTFVNMPGFAQISRRYSTNPALRMRIGGIWSPAAGTSSVSGVATNYLNAFSFRMSRSTKFRLGLMVDAFGGTGENAPDFVSVTAGTAAKAVANPTALRRDGTPEFVFFDVDGKVGNTVTVALHRKAPAAGAVIGFSMITFDTL